MKKVLALGLCFLLGSCQEAPVSTNNSATAKKLVGQWRNKTLRVKMNSYKNTDSSFVFEVNEKNWEKKMRIHPIRTYYKSDGTYTAEHISLDDSIIFNPAGLWLLSGDTLVLRDTFPERGLIFKYKLDLKNNMVQLWGMEDADGDGMKDDEYYTLMWRHFGAGQSPEETAQPDK